MARRASNQARSSVVSRRGHRPPRGQGFARLDPRPKALRRGDQRRQGGGLPRQLGLRPLDLALLIEIRRDEPLVQGEGGLCRLQDVGAVDDAQIGVHAQPQAFDGCGEVPGVDQLAVGGGLLADGGEAGAVQKRLGQRMAGERLVEPASTSGFGCGGPGEPRQWFEDDAGRGGRIQAGGRSTSRCRGGRAMVGSCDSALPALQGVRATAGRRMSQSGLFCARLPHAWDSAPNLGHTFLPPRSSVSARG
jgi:hypothetical protein